MNKFEKSNTFTQAKVEDNGSSVVFKSKIITEIFYDDKSKMTAHVPLGHDRFGGTGIKIMALTRIVDPHAQQSANPHPVHMPDIVFFINIRP